MVSPAQSNLTNASLLPAQVDNQISTALLKKTFDAARQEGDSAVQLIDSAGQAGPQAGDALVAKASGVGGLLDISA
jgi:predicted secreted Zn-dependent protease